MTATEVARMPKVTLYVKDSDAPIWDKARQIAGDSLSSIVSRALAAYVEQDEMRKQAESALEKQASRIEFDVDPDDRPKRRVGFTGVLVFEGRDDDVYVTTSGKVIRTSTFGSRVEEMLVYDDFDDFEASKPGEEAIAAVAAALGVRWVQELD